MKKISRGHILNSMCLVACGILMTSAISLFMTENRSSITDEQASCVLGGEAGITIGNTNCPASTFCNQIECKNGVCPDKTVQWTQTRQNYPDTSAAPGPEKGSKAKKYKCYDIQSCGTACLTSTVDNKEYCSGPVGAPTDGKVDGIESTGKKKTEKSVPVDDKDVDEGPR